MKQLLIFSAAAFLAACSGGGAPTAGQGSALPGQSIPVVNGDFEQTGAGGEIPGWTISQHAGARAYETAIDGEHAFKGRGSFRMSRIHEQVYGSIEQSIDVARFAGKTVELSAMLKSKDVGPLGWKLFLGAPGKMEYSPGLTGSSDWKRDVVKLELPKSTHTITIGASLLDGGTGWMDDVELHVLDR